MSPKISNNYLTMDSLPQTFMIWQLKVMQSANKKGCNISTKMISLF